MSAVRLEWPELVQAAVVGVMRHVSALKAGRRDRHGIKAEDGWGAHIEGACGEMAVAKATGVFAGLMVNTFKAPDVGRVQVRTRSRPDFELIVRDDDSDWDTFVLVTGCNGEYVVRGWIGGVEAKKPEWRQTHGGREPAFFVPHSALHPLQELKAAA